MCVCNTHFVFIEKNSLQLPLPPGFLIPGVFVSVNLLSEGANTIILPLVPWNTSCIYYMSLFGFTTLSFAPYVIFAYVNVAVCILCAIGGIFIFKAVPGNDREADWHIWKKKEQDEAQISVEAETAVEM